MNYSMGDTSRPKCVLITDNFPPMGGGVSRYYGGLASSYGAEMQVCSPQTRYTNGHADYPNIPIASNRLVQVGQAWAAARITRKAQNRIVLLGHPHLGLFSTLVPRSHPVGLIIHGGEWQEFKRFHRLLYVIEARCDFLVANSAATAADWLDSRLANKIMILRPGLDSEWIEKGTFATAEKSSMVLQRPFRLLTVARLVPRKGIRETARAVSDLLAEGQRVEIRIVGDGPYLDDFRNEFASEPAIQFLGPLSDEQLQKCYEWADAFVLCPHTITGGEGYEGFGIVYLEAAAYGLPIVATISGGVAEALDPAGSLTARPEDWEAVGDHLRRLVRMPQVMLAEMRAVNLRWARRNAWAQRADEFAAGLKERFIHVGD